MTSTQLSPLRPTEYSNNYLYKTEITKLDSHNHYYISKYQRMLNLVYTSGQQRVGLNNKEKEAGLSDTMALLFSALHNERQTKTRNKLGSEIPNTRCYDKMTPEN